MHDRDGKPVKVGDLVLVPCRVEQTHATEEFCNATLRTLYPMYPSDRHDTVVVNTRQLVVVEKGSEVAAAFEITQPWAACAKPADQAGRGRVGALAVLALVAASALALCACTKDDVVAPTVVVAAASPTPAPTADPCAYDGYLLSAPGYAGDFNVGDYVRLVAAPSIGSRTLDATACPSSYAKRMRWEQIGGWCDFFENSNALAVATECYAAAQRVVFRVCEADNSKACGERAFKVNP